MLKDKPQHAVLINNNQWLEIEPQGLMLSAVINQLSLVESSIAVAVNNNIINKALWHEYVLADGDQINVFSAIAGG
ncbi:sulfur carrier protein ThiS [Psychrobium sp. 1_MG-2023]|uniref:sulfur carrier protein ThiS n=1 Tax=Psychrobium sp. 1_MG-2023 TaxID=3062624 RepID=UPI000C33C008|nr:sulfur carrier protein ThiS [Psychrobium sp. 1_MG-2023]MDP2560169.1 sulfur carrier protein ThiS [Psychrobium sp. 1_MG-2023]PKF56980.1 thiamine biosynthesis protein ThiS [Alteromonadales bacterium alter-6D02]